MRLKFTALFCLSLAAWQTVPALPAQTAQITVSRQNGHNEVSGKTVFPDDRILLQFRTMGGKPGEPVWLPAVPGRFQQAEGAALVLFATWKPPAAQAACGQSAHDPQLKSVSYMDETGQHWFATGCGMPEIIAANAAIDAAINR
jgi:hypothetical protein